MGKPAIHMMPSQETKLRDSSSNSNSVSVLEANAAPGSLQQAQQAQHHQERNQQLLSENRSTSKLVWKGKQPPVTKSRRSDLKRSSTHTSHESSKTNKSSSSGESGLCSFVHSNASVSSSSPPSIFSRHHSNKNDTGIHQEWNTEHDSGLTKAGESSIPTPMIIDWGSSPISSNGGVRVAIENFEDIIEVTRQKSIVSEARNMASSPSPSPPPPPPSPKTARKIRVPSFSGYSSLSSGRLANKTRHANVDDEDVQLKIQESPSDGNGTSHTPTLSLPSASSESGDTFTRNEHVFSPRTQGVVSKAEKTASIAHVPSTPETLNIGANVEEKQGGFEVRYSFVTQEKGAAELADAVTSAPQHGAGVQSPNKPRRDHQLSSGISVSDSSAASSASFFSAMDEYLESRRNSNLNRRVKQLALASDSIEVLQTSNDEMIVVPQEISINKNECLDHAATMDFNSVMSPSTTNRVRKNPRDIATAFQVPPPHTNVTSPELLNEEMIQEGEPNFTEDTEEQHTSFEVCESGSVLEVQQEADRHQEDPLKQEIVEKADRHQEDPLKQEIVEKPYKLVRVDDSNALEVLQQSRKSQSGAKKILQMMTLRKKKNIPQSTKPIPHSSFTTDRPKNSIRIVGDDENNGAIELLRSKTTYSNSNNPNSSSAFSYDESDEDNIVRRGSLMESPVTLPVPAENRRILRVGSDFEILAPSSMKRNEADATTSPPEKDGAITDNETCRDSAQEDATINASASADTITAAFVPIPTSIEEKMAIEIKLAIPRARTNMSASNSLQKVQPVIESPSNRAKEKVVDCQNSAPIPSASPSTEINGQSCQTISSVEKDHKLMPDQVEQSPHQSNTSSVPKIPAPKNDTLSVVHKNRYADKQGLVESADENLSKKRPRRVKIQVLSAKRDGNNTKNIEVTPSVASSSVDMNMPEEIKPTPQDSNLETEKKYTTMVAKPISKHPIDAQKHKTSPTSDAGSKFKFKHVVHINVMGVAGIVFDRELSSNDTGHKISPVPPEQIRAVVGVSEPGYSVENMSAFSSSLVHAPYTKLGKDGKFAKANRRHIAVWASNHRGQTPGSVVESNVLETSIANGNDLKSKLAPKLLNLDVALAPSGGEFNHLAVVIGSARLEITDKMMRSGKNLTIDLPVQPIVQEGCSSGNAVINLRNTGKRGIRQLLSAKKSDQEKDKSWEYISDLSSVYAIDPSGDSMIRVQVRVDEIHTSAGLKTIQRKGSFANRTEATEDTADSSFDHSIAPPTTAACRAFDALVSMDSKEKKASGEHLFSKPVEFPSDFACKEKLFETKGEETSSREFRVFGRNVSIPSCSTESRMAVAKRIDNRIENIAKRVIDTSCAALRTDDDLSIVRNDTLSTLGSDTEYTRMAIAVKGNEAVNPQKLLEDMREVFGPVPTIKELKLFAKEIALTSGEYLFRKKSQKADNKVDDDSKSVESATLTPSEMSRLCMRSVNGNDSWKKRRDDDDETYSDDSEHSTSRSGNVENKNGSGVIETLGSFKAATFSDGGCEGDDEVSTLKDRAALIGGVAGEKDQPKQEGNRFDNDKPSLPSVVENIAEVLSTQPCSFFGTNEPFEADAPTGVWNRDSVDRVPLCIDQSDMLSVGELTAITLEKTDLSDRHRKILMNRFGLPTDIFSRGKAANSRFDDDDSQKNQRVASGERTSAIKQPPSENYFAEYEDGVSGVTSIYGTSKSNAKPIAQEHNSPINERHDVKATMGEPATAEISDSLQPQQSQEGRDVESV